MKLCITSTGKELEAKVDARFGRAAYFLIIDTDTNELEVVENTAAASEQGAGIGAVQLVADKGVELVLTGRVGPNALEAFRSSGIKLFEGVSTEDTVKEALAKFQRNQYKSPADPAAVPPKGHGGGRGLGRGMGGGGGQGRGRGGGGGRCRQG